MRDRVALLSLRDLRIDLELFVVCRPFCAAAAVVREGPEVAVAEVAELRVGPAVHGVAVVGVDHVA